MPFPQDVVSDGAAADVKAGATVDKEFPHAAGSTGAGHNLESLGHISAVLQTVAAAASTPTVKLQGSNDKANWTDLATHAHSGGDSIDTVVVDKPYRFFRVNKTVDGDVQFFLRLASASGDQ